MIAASAAAELAAAWPDPLEAGLAEAAAAGGLWLIAAPAPLAPPAALLRVAIAAEAAVAWEPRDGGWAIAGAGAAAELRADGPDRFAAIARGAAGLWARLRGATLAVDGELHARVALDRLDGLEVPAPRLVGGFAFAAGARAAGWDAFGDAWFALPRWTYARRGDRAWLILAVDAGETADADAARWRDERAAALAALAASAAPGPARLVAVREPDDADWRRQVDDIRAAIAAGRCDKIVAARASAVELADAIDPALVLARLDERHPDCTRFAIRPRAAGGGAATFVGATPERLVRQRGLTVETEALAGSIARSGAGAVAAAASRLLASDKDRSEHDLVVQAIAATLGPRCAELDVPATPVVRSLRHVLHLHTSVNGRLAAPGHILELVDALHPTPAVGGTPTPDALAWIAAHEPPRGWYAAPVGWFDAAGDGDFAVAIRSGLLDGTRAQVWAGAGIVRESDADAELAEVRLKQRALMGALGVL